MLDHALQARVSLIAIESRDTVNVAEILKFCDPKAKVVPFQKAYLEAMFPKQPGKIASNPLKTGTVYFYVHQSQSTSADEWRYRELWEALVDKEACLVIVNCPRVPPEAFDIGPYQTPKGLIELTLLDAFKSSDTPAKVKAWVATLLPALGGLSLREVSDLVKLAQAREGSISARTLTRTREAIPPGLEGLTRVNTDLDVYMPHPALDAFVKREKKYFLTDDVHQKMVPRGVLLEGLTGSGKTQGAKYIAAQFGIPLFRLDTTLASKWHGESDRNLNAALAFAAADAPCAILLDEIEKWLGTSEGYESASRQKLLSLLLWFMQENRDRVLVIMTTNNAKALPPELIRDGRISERIVYAGAGENEAALFLENLLDTLKVPDSQKAQILKGALDEAFPAGTLYASYSAVEGAAVRLIKAMEG